MSDELHLVLLAGLFVSVLFFRVVLRRPTALEDRPIPDPDLPVVHLHRVELESIARLLRLDVTHLEEHRLEGALDGVRLTLTSRDHNNSNLDYVLTVDDSEVDSGAVDPRSWVIDQDAVFGRVRAQAIASQLRARVDLVRGMISSDLDEKTAIHLLDHGDHRDRVLAARVLARAVSEDAILVLESLLRGELVPEDLKRAARESLAEIRERTRDRGAMSISESSHAGEVSLSSERSDSDAGSGGAHSE